MTKPVVSAKVDKRPAAPTGEPSVPHPNSERTGTNYVEATAFRIEVEKEGLPEDTARMFVKGNLTSSVSSQLKNEVSRLIARGFRHFEADLTELLYLDSTGLAAFVAAHKQTQEVSGSFKLVNPRRLIRHLFVSAKLDTVLDIGPATETSTDGSI